MISEVLIRAQKCPLYLFLKYAKYQKVNNIPMYLVKLLTLVCSYVSFYILRNEDAKESHNRSNLFLQLNQCQCY